MVDWAGVTTGFITYTAQVGSSLLRLGRAIGNFNYQLISCLIKLVAGAWSAICVFMSALSGAFCDIVTYIFEFLVEFGRFLHVSARLFAQLGIAILYILTWIYGVLEQFAAIVADVLLQICRSLGALVNDVLDSLGVSANSVMNLLKSTLSHCCNWISSATNYTKECTISFIVVTYGYIHHGVFSAYVFLKEQVFGYCVDTLSLVGSQIVSSCGSAWHYLCTNIPKLVSQFSSQDVLTIALIVSVILIMLTVLRKHGFTVPFLGDSCVGSRRGIIIDWNDGSDGMIFISDEEYEDSAEESVEGDVESDIESIGTNATTSHNQSDSEDDISDTDGTNDDSSSSSTSTTTVEEFEVAEESDLESGDENDQNLINIQLPQRNVQYGLRSRVTPSPARSFTKLSQNELERYLESERDKRLCVVCQDNPKNVLVLPCKHMCMCVTCAHHVATATNRNRRVCPLCRCHIHTVMDVYT